MRILSALSFTLLLSAPAFAADLGMYRPGNAYNSVSAAGADVCESHCAGDAECRGWNYVKANPRAQGICEFLSSVSTPIPSQISISGEGINAKPIASGLMQGGSNTVRVGTAVTPRAQNSVTRVGNRRIVREPVPQNVRPQTASTQPVTKPNLANMAGESLTAQQNRYRQQRQAGQSAPAQQQAALPNGAPQRLMRDPRVTARRQAPQQAPNFRPMLDGAHPQAYQQPRPIAPQANPYANPHVNPQANPHVNPQANPHAAMRQHPNAGGRPPVGQPIPPQMPQQQMQQPQVQQQAQPRLTREQALKQRQAAMIAQARQARQSVQNLTAEQAQQSLYGSLHDDVKVPAANSAIPQDQNAPIATAASRPTVPVETEALPAPTGFAGPPAGYPKG